MNEIKQQFRILVTSLSAKVPLLTMLRTSFANANIPLFIYGADSDPECLGQHFVDRFWAMPKISELTASELISFCKTHALHAVIPTRDGDLSFFARYREEFSAAGIFVLVSSLEGIESCYDKLAFHHAVPEYSIPTETNLDCLPGTSFVVKERYGSGSRGILLQATKQAARKYVDRLQSPVFQPWVDGQEYSVDLYLLRNGKALGTIARSRDLIANGEAQISTTVSNPVLEETCLDIAQSLKLSGHLVIQAIIDNEQKIHIIECNCRFGGASTLSIAAGLRSPLWLYCEACGIDPQNYPFVRSQVKLRLLRHATDHLIEMESHQ